MSILEIEELFAIATSALADAVASLDYPEILPISAQIKADNELKQALRDFDAEYRAMWRRYVEHRIDELTATELTPGTALELEACMGHLLQTDLAASVAAHNAKIDARNLANAKRSEAT